MPVPSKCSTEGNEQNDIMQKKIQKYDAAPVKDVLKTE
jgi:hypothetical protein